MYSMAILKNLSLAPLGAVFIALGTAGAVQAATFYGEKVSLGDGYTNSFVTLDNNGNPSDIGVVFSQTALESLPTGHASDIALNLSLPTQVSAAPFNLIELNYRPHGHGPEGTTFEDPHFDIDIYRVSEAERQSICPNPVTITTEYGNRVPRCVGDELELASRTPDPGAVPPNFVPIPTTDDFYAEAYHGVRWFDANQLLPQALGDEPFTSVYQYGYYDGKMVLQEVNFSSSFLQTKPNTSTPMIQPNLFPESGYYPTEYRLSYDATNQEYALSLTGLKYQLATPIPEPSSPVGFLAFGALVAVYKVKKKLKK
jgi:hypothetical protein